jgi:hypothetical protein
VSSVMTQKKASPVKLNERLYVGNQEGLVISAHCYLTYKSPGTAQIVTNIEPKLRMNVDTITNFSAGLRVMLNLTKK